MNEPIVTLVGNLAGEPELRFTPSGVAVCKFRMAQTPRVKDGTEWKDGDPFWINVTAWRKLGENCTETLKPGMRVIVQGRLEQRSYDHKDGSQAEAPGSGVAGEHHRQPARHHDRAFATRRAPTTVCGWPRTWTPA